MPRKPKLIIADEALFWQLYESGTVMEKKFAQMIGRTSGETRKLYEAFCNEHGSAAEAVNKHEYAKLAIWKKEASNA